MQLLSSFIVQSHLSKQFPWSILNEPICFAGLFLDVEACFTLSYSCIVYQSSCCSVVADSVLLSARTLDPVMLQMCIRAVSTFSRQEYRLHVDIWDTATTVNKLCITFYTKESENTLMNINKNTFKWPFSLLDRSEDNILYFWTIPWIYSFSALIHYFSAFVDHYVTTLLYIAWPLAVAWTLGGDVT